jgi:hypothetical protein
VRTTGVRAFSAWAKTTLVINRLHVVRVVGGRDRVFNAPMRDVIFPDVVPTVDRLANVCLEGIFDIEPRKVVGKLLQKRFLRVENPTSIEPWRALLAQNTVGPTPPAMPVFIAQGMMDDTVVPSVTLAYEKRLCANGSLVSLMRLSDVGHGTVAMKSARDAVAWMSDRLAGQPNRICNNALR